MVSAWIAAAGAGIATEQRGAEGGRSRCEDGTDEERDVVAAGERLEPTCSGRDEGVAS